MTQKVALIFGISGQAGAYLAHLLLEKNYVVHGTSRDCEANSFSNLKRIGIFEQLYLQSVSMDDFSGVMNVIKSVKPDEIYNLAGQSSVALSFEQPIATFNSVAVSTMNILECLRYHDYPTRFFNAASSDCFGETLGRANEETILKPCSPYAMAKAASYWAVASYRHSYNLHCASAILSNHESPLRPERFVTRKIVKAAVRISKGSKEKLSLGNLDIWRDWGWAPDYVYAIWRMMQYSEPKDFVIASGTTCSLREFVSHVFECLDLDWQDHVVTDQSLFRPYEIKRIALDPALAKTCLNWEATIKMPKLAAVLVACEVSGSLGITPWSTGSLNDFSLGEEVSK